MTNSYTIANLILRFVCSFADGIFIDRQDHQVNGYVGLFSISSAQIFTLRLAIVAIEFYYLPSVERLAVCASNRIKL
jgi:hypothetical protein